MNVADMASVVTLLGCTVAAGVSAASQGAGWYTPAFVLIGAAIGLIFALCVRRMAYALLSVGKDASQITTISLLLAYMFLPLIVGFAAIGGVAWLAAWSTRRFI
jgi:hypothetical protein